MPETFDVVILGGGLAGLTLAIHLRQQQPALTILVLEKKSHPLPEAAHKVGESSVEIGAHYFANVLGLKDHIDSGHLPKLGLRYFFDESKNDIAQRTELGGNVFFQSRSYQLDRGRLENFLGDRAIALGADFRHGVVVGAVDLGAGAARHQVAWKTADGQVGSATCRWVVDAAGRAAILKRKLGLQKDHGHKANSVWWRYSTRIGIDAWSDDAAWQARNGSRSRWLSTVHLMGEGYWVWLIPLGSGSTSVGIVADDTVHPFATMSSYEKSLEWLAKHEPQCREKLAGLDGQLQDFLGYKHFSYHCKQVYSADRWALVGEAGAFLDPFYSPGSDYIAMGNTIVADLIRRDTAGEGGLGLRVAGYNHIYFTLFENHLNLYEGQMPMWGNGQVMAAKVIWDFAYYWTVPAAYFFHGRLTDLAAFARHRDRLNRCGELNRAVQRLFRDWYQARPRIAIPFVDIPGIPAMHQLNRELQDPLDDAAFDARLIRNLAQLERLAGEILRVALGDKADVDRSGLPEPATAIELLATVYGDQARERRSAPHASAA
ncbi:halogenase [Planctomycetota bacterium]|nr:halogenase [Planctomycetota bacterium]